MCTQCVYQALSPPPPEGPGNKAITNPVVELLASIY